MTPRGIRNNNPLNLRKSRNAWKGKVSPGTDPAFEQFITMPYGIRAAMVNIRTILRRRANAGLATTVPELVSIWAPDCDGNNSSLYAAKVMRGLQMGPSDELFFDKGVIIPLCQEMAKIENGMALKEEYFVDAWDLI